MREAISSGVDGYDAETRKSVRKAAHGLRLTRETAMSIASKAVSITHSLPFPCLVLGFSTSDRKRKTFLDAGP